MAREKPPQDPQGKPDARLWGVGVPRRLPEPPKAPLPSKAKMREMAFLALLEALDGDGDGVQVSAARAILAATQDASEGQENAITPIIEPEEPANETGTG